MQKNQQPPTKLCNFIYIHPITLYLFFKAVTSKSTHCGKTVILITALFISNHMVSILDIFGCCVESYYCSF